VNIKKLNQKETFIFFNVQCEGVELMKMWFRTCVECKHEESQLCSRQIPLIKIKKQRDAKFSAFSIVNL
jgi:hypothetical protein